MIRRWSDTVYAGYVDDGGWFGRFVGCGSKDEAASYVDEWETRAPRHVFDRVERRWRVRYLAIPGAPGRSRHAQRPDDLTPMSEIGARL